MTQQRRKTPVLNIEIAAAGWRNIRGLKPQLERAAILTLENLPVRLQHVARRSVVTLLLTSSAAVRQLNRDFRGMDKPTNVLSFPQYEPPELTKLGKSTAVISAGDIAIAYQYIVVESKKERKILKNHAVHLLIHGILHLFGYDHLTDGDASRMERLEQKLMAILGLPDPYAAMADKIADNKASSARKRTRRSV